jgi:hypothetical protein
MALAHFGLQWEWHQIRDFGTLPSQLQWALFALNFSWSVLLLCIAALVLHVATRDGSNASDRRLILVVGVFWAIHGGYVALVPMPLPPSLSWLAAPLVVFPMTLVALHFSALLVGWAPTKVATVS